MSNGNFLTSIKIENVQSHKNTSIQFSPGVNVITGTSDSGKSSIIRGIKWLVCNRPSRDNIKSTFASEEDKQSVIGEFSDGHTVERVKNSTINAYIIDNDVKNPLEALKTNVPAEVTIVLGLTDVNIQDQHSPYFLLQDSSGKVATKFNEVIGLEAMDACLSVVNKKVSDVKQLIESNQKLYATKRTAHRRLEWVVGLDDIISAGDKVSSEIEKVEQSIVTLEEHIDRLTSLSSTIQDLNTFLLIENDVDTASVLYDSIVDVSGDISELSSQLQTLETIQESIKECDGIIAFDDILTRAETILHVITGKRNTVTEIEELITSAEAIHASFVDEEAKITDMESELVSLLSDLSICPLCDSKIS